MLQREWDRLRGRIVYSSAGLVEAWKTEHSFRFWVYMNVISCVVALMLPLGPFYQMVIICLGILILAAECLNTALERVVDMISDDHLPLGKAAKDTASAGVAVTALAAGVAWIFGVVSLL